MYLILNGLMSWDAYGFGGPANVFTTFQNPPAPGLLPQVFMLCKCSSKCTMNVDGGFYVQGLKLRGDRHSQNDAGPDSAMALSSASLSYSPIKETCQVLGRREIC
jgi:hypothetical protein